MSRLVTVVAALLFAFGLGIGGMLDPARVIGFLDLFGAWDPTLIAVMGAGMGVNAIAFRISRRRQRPLFDRCFYLPEQTKIRPDLVIGSAIFGVGWGLAGYCPGPALVTLGTASTPAVIMVGGMLVGSLLGRYASQRLNATRGS